MLVEAVVWPTLDDFCSCGLRGAHVDANAVDLWLDGPEGNKCCDDPGESFAVYVADDMLHGDAPDTCLPAQHNFSHSGAISDLLGDCHGRSKLCAETFGRHDDASTRGLLLFTQLHDEPGFVANWRGVWEPLPQALHDIGQGKKPSDHTISGGDVAFRAFSFVDTLVCNQTAIPNLDYNVQLVAASSAEVSPHVPAKVPRSDVAAGSVFSGNGDDVTKSAVVLLRALDIFLEGASGEWATCVASPLNFFEYGVGVWDPGGRRGARPPLWLEASDTIDIVKNKEGIPLESDYNIQESMLHLVLRLRSDTQTFAKTPTGKSFTSVVKASDTGDIMKGRKDIPTHRQCLIFAGNQLEDGRTLFDYDIQKDANGQGLTLVVEGSS